MDTGTPARVRGEAPWPEARPVNMVNMTMTNTSSTLAPANTSWGMPLSVP